MVTAEPEAGGWQCSGPTTTSIATRLPVRTPVAVIVPGVPVALSPQPAAANTQAATMRSVAVPV